VEGAVAVQQGEDALVLRQRPEDGVVRFSSGKNGSIFDFVMQTEGLTFPEAVERLAAQAGMPPPQVTHEEEARDQRRRTLHDIVELAAKFFEASLAARAGAKARGYLADRGIDAATQLRFRLGYAPAAATKAGALRSRSISARTASRSRTWSRPGCWWQATTSRSPTTASATA